MKLVLIKKLFNSKSINISVNVAIEVAGKGDVKELEKLCAAHDPLFTFMKKDGYYLCRQNAEGKSPLMAATENDQKEAMKWLISRYEALTLNQQDNDGKTALIIAVEHGRPEAVQLLLDSGARTDMVDKNNKTALQYAEESSPLYIAKMIHIAEKLRADVKAICDAADTMGAHGW